MLAKHLAFSLIDWQTTVRFSFSSESLIISKSAAELSAALANRKFAR